MREDDGAADEPTRLVARCRHHDVSIRFGREEWLRPYTDETLAGLARRGARVAALCPGFTADCLETLEEIGITGREHFLAAGGRFSPDSLRQRSPGMDRVHNGPGDGELQGWLSAPDYPPIPL